MHGSSPPKNFGARGEAEMTNIPLEFAQRRTKTFADRVMHDHKEAMECLDCEDMLRAGVDAFKAIDMVASMLREAVELEEIVFDDLDLEHAIYTLWLHWMEPVKEAEQRIAKSSFNGFEPDHQFEFKKAKERAIEYIEQHQWHLDSYNEMLESFDKDS
jgi:hypothetical protein